jgi:hypothetical protein
VACAPWRLSSGGASDQVAMRIGSHTDDTAVLFCRLEAIGRAVDHQRCHKARIMSGRSDRVPSRQDLFIAVRRLGDLPLEWANVTNTSVASYYEKETVLSLSRARGPGATGPLITAIQDQWCLAHCGTLVAPGSSHHLRSGPRTRSWRRTESTSASDYPRSACRQLLKPPGPRSPRALAGEL